MKKTKEENQFNWDSISISKYYDIMDIINDEGDDDMTKNVKIVSIILGIPEDEVWDMELSKAGEYISRLQFLGKFELPKIKNLKFNLPGYELEVIKDLNKINVAQYVDFQNFVKLPLRDGIEKLLSIFLIPVGHKYNDGYDILDLQQTIRECMSFRVAEGLLGFFLRKYSRLLLHSLVYCRRQIRKTKKKELTERWMKMEEETLEKIQGLTHLIGCS